jgi:plasmid maintenance system antidote protein VapI
MDGKYLIDKARALGHSDRETARLIGVDPKYLRKIYAGECGISEQSAVLLAELVGEDADDVLRRITVANEKDPSRKKALERVLFALGIWCVALVPLSAVTGDAAAATFAQFAGYTSCSIMT